MSPWLGLVVAMTGSSPALAMSSAAIAVRTEAVGIRYCSESPDADIVSARVDLKIRVRNRAQGPIVISLRPGVDAARVAVDSTLGARNEIEFETNADHFYIEMPRFGRSPDMKDFAVIEPNAELSVLVSAMVLVRRTTAEPIPSTIREGDRRSIEFSIWWGAAFGPMSGAQVQALAKVWRYTGDLFFETTRSPWIALEFPWVEEVGPCR